MQNECYHTPVQLSLSQSVKRGITLQLLRSPYEPCDTVIREQLRYTFHNKFQKNVFWYPSDDMERSHLGILVMTGSFFE